MKLVESTHPAIRTASRTVTDEELATLQRNWPAYLQYMTRNKGMGFAANQIGDTRRWFVWQNGLVINPVITWTSPEHEAKKEGCLTFPGLLREMVRPRSIKASYMDERGKQYTDREFTGISARIFQHEHDHLNGKVIAD